MVYGDGKLGHIEIFDAPHLNLQNAKHVMESCLFSSRKRTVFYKIAFTPDCCQCGERILHVSSSFMVERHMHYSSL